MKVVEEAAGTIDEVGDVGEQIEVVSVDPDLDGANDRIRLLAFTA